MNFADTRYNRQEVMPQFYDGAQQRLGGARVVSVGAGGVKSSLLYHLAAAGVGNIHIIDFDHVELSNLNRQILYRTHDIGRPKAEAAAEELKELNPDISVTFSVSRVDEASVGEQLNNFDVILEGGDGPDQRMLVNKFAWESRTPMVHVSAQYAHGYVFTMIPPKTACLNCAFPDLPESRKGPTPVWGIATGMAGMLGANEVVKVILEKGELATNELLCFSNMQNRFYKVPIAQAEDCETCQLQ